MYKVALSKKAEKHLESAYDWYQQQKPRLGIEFLDAVEMALNSIEKYPFSYSFRRKNIRGCIVHRFPYIILFYVKRNNIRIVAVFHMHRKPA